jgi:hypothetical protein
MLPSMLDWTMRILPSRSATMETYSDWLATWHCAHRRGCTHDEFDGISKGGIHQSSQCLSQLGRNLLGRKGQQGGEGHNGDEVEAEDGDGVHVESAGDDADGHEDKEDVDIVAAEGGPDGARNVLGHGLPFGFMAIVSAGEQRRLLVVVGAVQDSAIAAAGRHVARIGVV